MLSLPRQAREATNKCDERKPIREFIHRFCAGENEFAVSCNKINHDILQLECVPVQSLSWQNIYTLPLPLLLCGFLDCSPYLLVHSPLLLLAKPRSRLIRVSITTGRTNLPLVFASTNIVKYTFYNIHILVYIYIYICRPEHQPCTCVNSNIWHLLGRGRYLEAQGLLPSEQVRETQVVTSLS